MKDLNKPAVVRIVFAILFSIAIGILHLLLFIFIWPIFSKPPFYASILLIAYVVLPWLLAYTLPEIADYLWLAAFTAMFFLCFIALNHPHGKEIDVSALHLLGTWQEYTQPGFGFAPVSVSLVINKLMWWLDAALLCFLQSWMLSVLLKTKVRKYHLWIWTGIAVLALCANWLAVHAEKPWYSAG